MKFWTAVHEMGHAFNLAHSWQKALGTPWVPLANDPTARSFMNYPYKPEVGGVPNFFKSFFFRFTDAELLFMRHAPERFVQMGNAAWFDHHGFEDGTPADDRFVLAVDILREKPVFEFLKPVLVQVTLTNVSDEPQIVPTDVLDGGHDLAVVVTRNGGPSRVVAPFSRTCSRSRNLVLQQGESVTRRVFASAGTAGGHISEPGRYTIQAAVELGGARVVSGPVGLRVRAPRGYSEEDLAMDFFTDGVARALNFEGTRALDDANDVLREITRQLPDHRVTAHARPRRRRRRRRGRSDHQRGVPGRAPRRARRRARSDRRRARQPALSDRGLRGLAPSRPTPTA